MDIFVATEADIAALAQVEITTKKQSVPDVEAHEIDHALRLQRWQTYFNTESPQTSKPDRLVLKAMIDGTMVGYLAGHLTTRFQMDAEIQSFYILKPYQRQGIGKALLTAFVRWLMLTKSKSVCVGISPSNPYQRFYLKHGGNHLNEHWIVWPDTAALLQQLSTGSDR